MKSKIARITVSGLVLFSLLSGGASSYAKSLTVMVNGKDIQYTYGQPTLMSDRTLVPSL
jgi:hypothetical protein